MKESRAPSTSGVRPITVIVPLPPTYRGGTEEYAYRLAGRFAQVAPVRLLTTTVRWVEGGPMIDVGQIPMTRLPARELFQRPVVMGHSARQQLRVAATTSSVVQLHMPFPLVEAPVTRWAARAGVPVVLTYHMDADFGGASSNPAAGLITFGYRRLSAFPALREARAVVSNSRGYAEASPVLSRFLPKVRVIAKGVDPVRLGIDVADGRAAPRAEPGASLLPGSTREERRVVFVGRLVPYKGLHVLLDAFAKLREVEPAVRLYIAGRGPQESALRAQVDRLGLGSAVVFLGFVPDERLGELYRSADLVACPSVSLLESTATALEEAAALGTPIVGSDLPGTSESVPNDGVHGLLAPPGNAEAVFLALRRLLGQSRPTTRPAARTWDQTAAEYLALFRSVGAEIPG